MSDPNPSPPSSMAKLLNAVFQALNGKNGGTARRSSRVGEGMNHEALDRPITGGQKPETRGRGV